MNPTETLSEIETWVVDVCRDLGLPIKTASDDFFESGGSVAHRAEADHPGRGALRRGRARSR